MQSICPHHTMHNVVTISASPTTHAAKLWKYLIYIIFTLLARVRVPEEYLGMVISEELKVEWFIPTLTGPGVVTVAMLDLLVGAHNDFIEKSRAVLKKGQKTE